MLSLSVIIPTYGRDRVLVDTLVSLLAHEDAPDELIVMDQSTIHAQETTDYLGKAHAAGKIRWIRHDPPGTVGAMNRGLVEARGDVALFLDDDIEPSAGLISAHRRTHAEHPEAWAVVGRVVQPEDGGKRSEVRGQRSEVRSQRSEGGGLRKDLDFAFHGTVPAWVENVMAGNLSVKRERALAIGGFDANFIPPVSFRFETEFAKRLVAAGGRILFEPGASLRHLRAPSGGTRSRGSYLTSASPLHSVGDYYYALCRGRPGNRTGYIVQRFRRRVLTRFYLAHPWYVPARLVGELRAIRLAFALHAAGPKLIAKGERGNP